MNHNRPFIFELTLFSFIVWKLQCVYDAEEHHQTICKKESQTREAVICGYTSREIADAFNDTVDAVTKRIQRAKKKMKGYIQNLLV